MADGRSGKKQIDDLYGLLRGRNKIEQGRIVPKNPAPQPQPPQPTGHTTHIETTIREED